jgi:pimeloyl-ACP methyl ester carboxylesterase
MKNEQINAGGIETNYLTEGDGPPVILVHGGGLGTDAWGNWRGCIPLLAKHFRVFAIDMVGFGRTAKPDPKTFRYDQDSRVRHIAAFIERLGIVRPSLVGKAMGGITSLGVAMERPDLVSRLVLTGSPGIRGAESNATRVVMSYQPTPQYMRKLVTALTAPGFKVDPELIEIRSWSPRQRRARLWAAQNLRCPAFACSTSQVFSHLPGPIAGCVSVANLRYKDRSTSAVGRHETQAALREVTSNGNLSVTLRGSDLFQ